MLSLANLASNIIDREAFAACTNDFSRITCLLSCSEFVSLLKKSSALLDEQTTCLKCVKSSTEFREKGNEAYASNNNQIALSFYNQAIRYAPSYSRELSLALGNRSATLFNLKYYHLASQDVHRALDLLSSNEEDDVRRQRLEQRLQQCLRHKAEDEQIINDDNTQLEHELEQLKLNQTFNTNYSSLTSHADIHSSSDRGRHVVSANNSSILKPGTIILIEKPYASVLLPSAWLTHCHMCLRRIQLIVFPCSQCTRAVYCSFDCLQSSILWHAFECRLTIDRLDKMQLLALRLITKTGWQELFKNKVQFENYLKGNKIENETDKTYQWDNYENILKLETNSHKRSVDDLLQRSIQACSIGVSLIGNTSFSHQAYENLDYQIYICSLLLSHLQSLPCNAHEISEFIYHRSSPLSSSCNEIGAGIYATLSLFNHACNPNVIRNFIGDTVLVRLLSSISSNNIELVDNYGCLSATMAKDERQKKLDDQYHFQCQCQPCIEQWPNYDRLPEGTGEKNIISKPFDEAFQRLIQGEIPSEDDLHRFEDFIAQCDEQMPGDKTIKGKVYNNAQEAYKQCLNFFYHSISIED
ncbi:unnamed protein product [Rotaria magnacalcarata]|uniref:SET and MYND domain-containing protein 4 n=7 Tax=Rotaria magnacalcarata TaxID=392030 RepID=A0A815YSV2_9BILA|nr:unnamed protein product [Rotaria magnacalcarata]CAF1637949.1 unnamed protein product [Rotaria magnacalcarata]CAF1990314.1 unnamed protein product [Rotaria magnacalcarata]CAF2077522.1 unnamed protein product [Rotaria magnacalcarata]CAF3844837.1 unnamed protein product [Rotaria magnacalcarata]